MTSSLRELYEPHVEGARRALVEDPAMVALLDPAIDPLVLERFLIQFCALGVQITSPVGGWIRRAGERCQELGLKEIGQLLVKHAEHEEGHHLMLMTDARLLVGRWNQRGNVRLDPDALMALPASPGMKAYIALHEDTIASDIPYGQVAIELEIERMSTTFGPKQLALCKLVLGASVLNGLSFIQEHVALDVGHTALNEKIMERLLGARPDAALRLADVGGRAIRAYVRFFGECLSTAQDEVARMSKADAKLTA
jgi:hypothetical protein